MERPLTVGQLARATGVPAKTIRFYEPVGVLPVPERSASRYRQYARRDVDRLVFVRRARALGLSLPQLKMLTGEFRGRNASPFVADSKLWWPSSCASDR
jgi:DNA-binding transcriptional MerR regulator